MNVLQDPHFMQDFPTGGTALKTPASQLFIK